MALAPIPPVQVFGLFIAFGVFAAWLLTMLFLPAFIMLLGEEGLQKSLKGDSESGSKVLTGGLRRLGGLAVGKPLIFPVLFIVLGAVAIPGMLSVSVNDNPVKWFKSGSDIRVATEFKVFTNVHNVVVDPKEFDGRSFVGVPFIGRVPGARGHQDGELGQFLRDIRSLAQVIAEYVRLVDQFRMPEPDGERASNHAASGAGNGIEQLPLTGRQRIRIQWCNSRFHDYLLQ